MNKIDRLHNEQLEKDVAAAYKQITILKKLLKEKDHKNSRLASDKRELTSDKKVSDQKHLEKDALIAELSHEIIDLKELITLMFSLRDFDALEFDEKNLAVLLKVLKTDEAIKALFEKKKEAEEVTYDSSNTSFPPSSDEIRSLGKKTKPKKRNHNYNSREKTDRKKGAQKGHRGKTLTAKEVENLIESKAVKVISKDIGQRKGNQQPIKRYVLDLEITPVVKVYHIYEQKIPDELKKSVTYGANVRSFIVLLYTEGQVAVNRIQNMINELSELEFNISEGTVYNYYSDFVRDSQVYRDEIAAELLEAKVMGTDSTKFETREGSSYVRNHSTDQAVLYIPTQTKSLSELFDTLILPNYNGYLLHDHETGLYRFTHPAKHAECNAHLGRDLQRIQDETHHQWARDLQDLLYSVNSERKKLISEGKTGFTSERISEIEHKAIEILKSGWLEYANSSRNCSQTKEHQVLVRLTNEQYRTSYLRFTYDFDVPFTNNISERDLRKVVNRRKQIKKYGDFKGLEKFCQAISVTETMKRKSVPQLIGITHIIKRNAPML